MKTITSLLSLFLTTLSLLGANPAFNDFNTTRFDVTGNKVDLKVSSIDTNFFSAATMAYLASLSGGGAQVWSSNNFNVFLSGSVDGTAGAPIDRVRIDSTNGLSIHSPGVTIGLSQGDISFGGVDFYAYGSDVAFLGFDLDSSGYGGCLDFDPNNDNRLPQPFGFSTTYDNVIAPTDVLFAFANSHTNKVFCIGDGTLNANAYVIYGTNNQLIFGATNTAPIYEIVPDAFVSVQVAGSTNAYRMALYDLAGTNVTEAIINNNLTIQTNLTVNQTITTKVVKGGTLIITNVSFYGSVTNHNVATNSVIIADASQIETNAVNAHGVFTNTASGPPSFGLLQNTEIEHSVIEATNEVTRQINSGTNIYVSLGTAISDLSLGTNGVYQYITNNSGSTTLNWQTAYRTNLAANVTYALTTPKSAFYETLILWVTNSSGSTFKTTWPSGVIGPVGSGTPAVLYCTNGNITRFVVEHYGPADIVVNKSDYGP